VSGSGSPLDAFSRGARIFAERLRESVAADPTADWLAEQFDSRRRPEPARELDEGALPFAEDDEVERRRAQRDLADAENRLRVSHR
jgi:hypothetical protein